MDGMPNNEHNRLYSEACDILFKYAHLEGRPNDALVPDKEEINKGILMLYKCLEINPDNYPVYFLIGKGHQVLEEHEKACIAMIKATNINPKQPDIWGELALEYLTTGNYLMGLRAVNKAVELRPDYGPFVANLAIALLYNGRIKEAKTKIKEALRLQDSPVSQTMKIVIEMVESGKKLPEFANLFREMFDE